MNVKQLAEYTQLSSRTIYNLVYQKKVPFKRISQKKVVFYKEEIDEWLAARNPSKKEDDIENQSIQGVQTEGSIDTRSENSTGKISLKLGTIIGAGIFLLICGWGSNYLNQRYGRNIAKQEPVRSLSLPMARSEVKTMLENAEIRNLRITPSYINPGGHQN